MNIHNLYKLLLLITCAFVGDFTPADVTQATQEQILAPGYGSLQFTAPEPGTYNLPILGAAADGAVLDPDVFVVGAGATFPPRVTGAFCANGVVTFVFAILISPIFNIYHYI